MERFGVEWLLIQPSIAQKLYDYLNTSGTKLPPKIKYIELNGENISKVTEKKFKDFFEVNVANLYGANEVNAIAYECPFGHMHILEDNVLVQLYNAEIKGKETSGNIVVSSLTNSVFPIIGYDLGDKVCVENLSCPCGNPARVIKEIYGRKTDEIEVNGKSIDPFCLTYCVENINSRFGNPIRQFKVVFSNNELISVGGDVVMNSIKSFFSSLYKNVWFGITTSFGASKFYFSMKFLILLSTTAVPLFNIWLWKEVLNGVVEKDSKLVLFCLSIYLALKFVAYLLAKFDDYE